MSVYGDRCRTFVGGVLVLIGALGGLSQIYEITLVLPPSGSNSFKDTILTKYLTTTGVVYLVHFILMSVAGYRIVRGFKRAMLFLWLSVFAWLTGVAVTAWFSRIVAVEGELDQIQPDLVIFLNVAITRFVMVLPSIIALIYVRVGVSRAGSPAD